MDIEKIEAMLLAEAASRDIQLEDDFLQLVREDINILEYSPEDTSELTIKVVQAAEKIIAGTTGHRIDKQSLINFKKSAFGCPHAYGCTCWTNFSDDGTA